MRHYYQFAQDGENLAEHIKLTVETCIEHIFHYHSIFIISFGANGRNRHTHIAISISFLCPVCYSVFRPCYSIRCLTLSLPWYNLHGWNVCASNDSVNEQRTRTSQNVTNKIVVESTQVNKHGRQQQQEMYM